MQNLRCRLVCQSRPVIALRRSSYTVTRKFLRSQKFKNADIQKSRGEPALIETAKHRCHGRLLAVGAKTDRPGLLRVGKVPFDQLGDDFKSSVRLLLEFGNFAG